MQGILSAIGKDCLMFIAERELPLPEEYDWFPLEGLVSEPPADVDERTIVFLDCGNVERNPAEAFRRPGMHILDIDHHHDWGSGGTTNEHNLGALCPRDHQGKHRAGWKIIRHDNGTTHWTSPTGRTYNRPPTTYPTDTTTTAAPDPDPPPF